MVRRAVPIAVLLAVLVAIGLATRLLGPPPVAAPTASDGPPPSLTVAIPAADPVPWAQIAWQEVPEPFPDLQPVPAGQAPMRVDGLIDAGDLLVGWGRAPTPGRNQFNDMGAVFISRSGRDWRAVPIEHGVGPADTSEIAGVAAGPLGLLAFGGVCCESEARAAWHSSDGEHWTRLELAGDIEQGAAWFAAVAGVADGWVAVGSSDGTAPGFWRSDDGATWTASEAGDVGSGTVSDVAVGPDGLIAIGTVDGPDGTHDGGIWTSADGRTWTRVGAEDRLLAGAGEVELWSVVPFARGLFVTGSVGSTEDRVQCESLTSAMVASAELLPPRMTGLSCGWGREHHWISADGRRWQRADPANEVGEHPIEFRLVAAGGPGLVVLGESSAPASPDTALFISGDGMGWTVLPPPQPLGNGVAYGLAVEGRDVLAVVNDFDGAASTVRIFLGLAD